MCGRFTNKLTWDEIARLYRLTIKAPPHNLPPRYNICPTDPVDVVTQRDGNRDFTRMRLGLVPSWWPKPRKELKAATFNARVETVAEKPFFREAFRRTRCLIPASGYYCCNAGRCRGASIARRTPAHDPSLIERVEVE